MRWGEICRNILVCTCSWKIHEYSTMKKKITLLFILLKGFGLEACFLLGVGYTRDTTTAITCLTIAVGVSGFAISGRQMYFHISYWEIIF